MASIKIDREHPLFSSDEIQARVEELGRQITVDYQDRPLLLIGVLKGAFIFLADLARAIDLPLEIDFIRVASYGVGLTTSGTVRLTKDPDIDPRGKDVLVVEDIVDTGTTLSWLRTYFEKKGAASVRICALIDKYERRQHEVQADYSGFSVSEGFLVGYGLDCAEQYRNLAGIYNVESGGNHE